MAKAKRKRTDDAEDIPVIPEKSAGVELLRYRSYVAAFARGERLTPEADDDLGAIRDFLEIPTWSMRRDVMAVLRWQRADRCRRVELLHCFPHLFDDVEVWAAGFIDNRQRRLRMRSQSAEAIDAAGS